MKPIEPTTGLERAVNALLGNTAKAITTTFADKLLVRPRPAKRRRARQPLGATRGRRSTPVQKGGGRHG